MNVSLPPKELKDLLANCRVLSFDKNQSIIQQGELPNVAYVVKSGVVKVYDINTSGEEKVITYTDKYGLCRLNGFLENLKQHFITPVPLVSAKFTQFQKENF